MRRAGIATSRTAESRGRGSAAVDTPTRLLALSALSRSARIRAVGRTGSIIQASRSKTRGAADESQISPERAGSGMDTLVPGRSRRIEMQSGARGEVRAAAYGPAWTVRWVISPANGGLLGLGPMLSPERWWIGWREVEAGSLGRVPSRSSICKRTTGNPWSRNPDLSDGRPRRVGAVRPGPRHVLAPSGAATRVPRQGGARPAVPRPLSGLTQSRARCQAGTAIPPPGYPSLQMSAA